MPPKVCPECGIPIGTPLPPLRRFSMLALLPLFCALTTLALVVWHPLTTVRTSRPGWRATIPRFPGPELTAGYLHQIADGTKQIDPSLASRLLKPSVVGINVPAPPDDATLSVATGPPAGNRAETVGYGWPSYWILRSKQSPYDNMFERTGTHALQQNVNLGGVSLGNSYVHVSLGTDPLTGQMLDWVIDASGPATSAAIVVFSWYILCALRWGICRIYRNTSLWVHRLPVRGTIFLAILILLAGLLHLKPDISYNANSTNLTFHPTTLRLDQLTSTDNRLSDTDIARSILAALPAEIPSDAPLAIKFLMHPGNNVNGNDSMYGAPAWIYKITQTRSHPLGETATPFPPGPAHIQFPGWDRTIFYAPIPPGSAIRTLVQIETPVLIQQLFLIYLAWAIPTFAIHQIRNVITRRRTRNNACIACGYAIT